MNIKPNTVAGKVFDILTEFPKTRDSDKLLWLTYMEKHHNLMRVLKKKPKKFLEFYLGDILSHETIRRTRQKIQQHYPNLRRKGKVDKAEIRSLGKFPSGMMSISNSRVSA